MKFLLPLFLLLFYINAFSQITVQAVLESSSGEKRYLTTETGIPLNTKDSLYFVLNSNNPNIKAHMDKAPIDVIIANGSSAVMYMNITGLGKLNSRNLLKDQILRFNPNDRLVIDFNNAYGIKNITLPFKED